MWLTDFLNLFFPNQCQSCGISLTSGEKVLCLSCVYKLPKTNFQDHIDNPLARIFWGRAKLHAVTSFLFFNKGGNVQKLIHNFKYKGNIEAGRYLGEIFGRELNNSSLFNSVDIIVPVPLHSKKLKKRGFNQSTIISEGISISMKKPVDDISLQRIEFTETQTKKARYTRWENVKGKFGLVDSSLLEGKHILLVDDVLTTGATLESCAQTLLEIPEVKISMATLAYAQA